MPLIFRGMNECPNTPGKPRIGDSADALGVRPTDIPVDGAGMVRPCGKGMSVAPDAKSLPPHRIPKRYATHYPKASGSNSKEIWMLGSGGFVVSRLAQKLQLFVTSATHGVVEPDAEMAIDEYKLALAATQQQWFIFVP
jgi:hypothetical protein